MGLDMFIIKRKKGSNITTNDMTYEEWKESEVAYWRKANQIHKWFVDNIQNGIDDCKSYIVKKQQLEELLTICEEILNKVKLINGKQLINKYNNETRKFENIEVEALIIDDKTICEEKLPTQEGFFFGSYNYDEWYYEDIKNTYYQLRKILEEINFEEYDLYYESSW